ncbi:MAG: hypothetical protein D6784_15945 [Chloroflexi bacterium]|nr:MAG: hypothetical protein D6784_15945 [Chloroflexota bacterium]
MQIDWTVLTYFVIGLFALNGFFRGWWKEAITTAFLAFLVFLLAQPDFAASFVELVNTILQTVWSVLPTSLTSLLQNSFPGGPVSGVSANAIRIDPSDGNTWLLLLIVVMAVAILLGRMTLPAGPGGGYQVRPVGSLLGGLVGGLNGLIVMNLVREYIEGRNLPGSAAGLPTEIAARSASTPFAVASSGVSIQAVNVPSTTIMEGYLPWILMIIGGLVFLAALKTRVGMASKDGFRKINYKTPMGYKKY